MFVQLEHFWMQQIFVVRFFKSSSSLCSYVFNLETAYILNHTCTMGSNECDSTKDLYCNNSLCQCDFSTKYWNINFQTCSKTIHEKQRNIIVYWRKFLVQRVNYSGICTFDSDCVPTLSCPSMPGVCTCPSYLPDYACNCAVTEYYDPNLVQCGTTIWILGYFSIFIFIFIS